MGLDALNNAMGGLSGALNSLLGLGAGDSYENYLLDCTIDGVPFEQLDCELGIQHNNIINVFPTLDEEPAENYQVLPNGTEPESFTIYGLVAGNDYHIKRDALIKVLRLNRTVTLVDRYHGAAIVMVQTASVREARSDGEGVALFTISFVNAAAPTYLYESGGGSKGSLLEKALGMLEGAVDTVTETLDLAGQPARIIDKAIKKVKSELELAKNRIVGAAKGLADNYTDLVDTVENLFDGDEDNTREFAQAASALTQQVADADELTRLASAYDELPDEPTLDAATPAERAAQSNEHALGRFFRSTYLGAAAAAVAETEFESIEDATRTRDRLVERLAADGQPELALTVYQYISDAAAELNYMRDYEPRGVSGSLLIAYELYGDAERADEVAALNDVMHPAFISRTITVKST